MRKKGKFDAILVETTGLADPAPVSPTFFIDENVGRKTKFDAAVTVVDAKWLNDRLKDVPVRGTGRRSVRENNFVQSTFISNQIIWNPTLYWFGSRDAEVRNLPGFCSSHRNSSRLGMQFGTGSKLSG
jgi:hypothetical protein